MGHHKGGHNRERKCRIPRKSPPPPALCTKGKVAKGGGGRICGTLRCSKTSEQRTGFLLNLLEIS